jgi:hypothetical protein
MMARRLMMGAKSGGADLLSGLSHYWKLDESSGNAIDAHGDVDLSEIGTLGYDSGVVYSAARESATFSNYLNDTSQEITFSNRSFTVNFWVKVKTESSTGAWLFNTRSGNYGFQIYTLTSRSDVNFLLYNGTSSFGLIDQGFLYTLNTWNMVTAWVDIENELVGLQLDNGTPAIVNTSERMAEGDKLHLFIKADSFSEAVSLKGQLGPCALWLDRALSADDRAALWNNGAGLAYEDY